MWPAVQVTAVCVVTVVEGTGHWPENMGVGLLIRSVVFNVSLTTFLDLDSLIYKMKGID